MKVTFYTQANVAPITDRVPEELQPSLQVVLCRTREELLPHLADTEVLISTGRLEEETVLAMPQLRWIQTLSAGVDTLPLEAIASRQIALTNAKGIHQVQMSEFALMLMLGWARGSHLHYLNQKNKVWGKKVPVAELYGSTLGVLGAGSIGEAIAAKGKAFSMRTLAYNRSGKPAPGFDETLTGVEGLNRILAESDYLVMLMPSTPETKHFLGLEQFRLMKPTSFFINLARGAVVKEEELVEALRERVIGGAALDVFDKEPLPEDSPLWTMDNVILTPHVAGLSPRYMERASGIVYENLRHYLKGEPLINAVNPGEGY